MSRHSRDVNTAAGRLFLFMLLIYIYNIIIYPRDAHEMHVSYTALLLHVSYTALLLHVSYTALLLQASYTAFQHTPERETDNR